MTEPDSSPKPTTDPRSGGFFHRPLPMLVILLIGAFLRMSHFLQSQKNPLMDLPILDETYYLNLGRIVAGGDIWGGSGVFFMDPLYGYWIGLMFRIFGFDPNVIRFAQIVLDVFNIFLVFHLGSRLSGRRAGTIAALLYSVSGLAIFYTLLILKTTLSITGLLLYTLLCLRCGDSEKWRSWLGLGFFAGILTALRGNFLLMVPFTMIGILFLGWGRWRIVARNHAVFLMGVLAVLCLCGIRNYVAGGEWVLLTSQSGRLLYSTNNPENLSGRYNVPSFSRPHPEDSERDFHREAEKRLGKLLTVKEVSAYWRNETVRFLREHPSAMGALFWNKLLGTLGNYEIPDIHSFEMAAGFSSAVRSPVPNFAFALALGLPGLAIGFVRNRRVGWLFMPVGMVFVTVMVFYTSSRFRMPAVPFLLLGCGISLEYLWDRLREKEWKRVVLLSTLCAGLAFVSMSASRPQDTGTESFFLAKAYLNRNQPGEAEKVLAQALTRFPDQARFHVLLGMASLSEQDPDAAILDNEKAIALEPQNPDAHHNLAVAYLMKRRYADAVSEARRAYDLYPVPRYLFTLATAFDKGGELENAKRFYSLFLQESKGFDPYQEKAKERLSQLNEP